MKKWNDETLLEVVEMYAEENSHLGYIASEEELSDRFDAMIEEMGVEYKICPKSRKYDWGVISEDFNAWKDNLCRDGEIHPEQCDAYCYVGVYS